MTIKEQGRDFIIKFTFNPRLVNAVKALPERRFNYHDKSWSVPIEHREEIEKFARRYNFDISGKPEMVVPELPPLPDLGIQIPLKRPLYPYQRQGVAYAIQKKRLIIGDQPGLGKTGQAIAALIGGEVNGEKAFPALVICPSSLKINWQREFVLWSDKRAIILNDKVKTSWPLYLSSGMADVVIVNYESLRKYFVQEIMMSTDGSFRLKDVTFRNTITTFKSVIIDESHRVRNTGTQIAKFVKGVCIGKDYVIALTGTPVINKPKDLISQLGIINRLNELGGWKGFVTRYCSGETEASNLKELNYKLSTTCFVRRDKKDVLKDLPDKIRQEVICEIDNRKEYTEAENDLINYLVKWKNATDEQIEKAIRGEVMVRINILKNISARGKINDVCEYIDDILESGEKLVLFGHLQEVLKKIAGKYGPRAVMITGEVSQKDRQHNVDRFQKDPECQLAVCSIKAAGVGLTLTASSRVAFIEQWWTAADHDQAEDRVHRIGQKDSVTATYFLGRDTIDEKVHEIVESKRGIAKQVTGSNEEIPVDTLKAFAELMLKNRSNG